MSALILSGALALCAHTGPREDFKAAVEAAKKAPADMALRSKAVAMARKLKPAPALPETALRLDGRAQFVFQDAKNEADFAAAAIILLRSVEGHSVPEPLKMRDLRLSGGELSYQIDTILSYVGGGSEVCATHSVRGTVSADGAALTLASKRLLAANRSERCYGNFGDTVEAYTR